jgi:hypothetical protein
MQTQILEPSELAEAVMLLLCIWEVPGLNLGCDIIMTEVFLKGGDIFQPVQPNANIVP